MVSKIDGLVKRIDEEMRQSEQVEDSFLVKLLSDCKAQLEVMSDLLKVISSSQARGKDFADVIKKCLSEAEKLVNKK